jgi:hypothetical protein
MNLHQPVAYFLLAEQLVKIYLKHQVQIMTLIGKHL